MARLFVFAIGGTGSRVLRSLTMLLASGVKSTNDFEIIPVIVDPHNDNKDLQLTEELLRAYEEIHQRSTSNEGFFSTRINSTASLSANNNANINDNNRYRFSLPGMNGTFRNYINYRFLNNTDKLMVDFLFSGKTIDRRNNEIDLLDLDMQVGFIGNPHIGSVALNQFQQAQEYQDITQNIQENDRIFIISSIFGGTGSAGFPMIFKNIRAGNANNNQGFLRNAKVGAVSVLPYFSIETDENSPIKPVDFIPKTKSALKYYINNISDDINAHYFIGDDKPSKAYKNDPGYDGQKNNAHFIEMVAALSIIDFMNLTDGQLTNASSYKHFSITQNSDPVTFLQMGEESTIIKKRLTQFFLFYRYYIDHLNKSVDKQPWSNQYDPLLTSDYFKTDIFAEKLKSFLAEYSVWLHEMKNNSRKFSPFNLDPDSKLSLLIQDISAKKEKKFKKFFDRDIDFNDFDGLLNEYARANQAGQPFSDEDEKLLSLFYTVTSVFVDEYYPLSIIHK